MKTRFFILRVTDGIQTTDITIWENYFSGHDKRIFNELSGIKIIVTYDEDRNNFTIARNTTIIPLMLTGEMEIVKPVSANLGDDPIW